MLKKIIELYKQNKLNDLLRIFVELDKKKIKNPKIENIKGLVFHKIGNLEKSKNCFLEAINLEHTFSDPYINFAKILLNENKINEAKEFFSKAIKYNSNSTIALNNLGEIYSAQSDFETAKDFFAKSIQSDPTSYVGYFNMGCLYYKKKDYQNSINFFLKSLEYSSNNFSILNNIGLCYSRIGQISQSNIYYKKALEIKNNPDISYQLANNFKKIGDLNASINLFSKILETTPKHSKTILAISRSKKFNILNFDDIDHYYQDEKNPLKKAEYAFSLFNILHKKKKYQMAAKYLDEANLIIANTIPKVEFDEKVEFDFYKNFFDKNFFQNINNTKKSANQSIIFIVGMPRSGSTLIEQIVSSHSKVQACGEVDYLYRAITDYYSNLELNSFIEQVKKSTKIDFENIMNSYLSKHDFSNNKGKIITDKLLNNFRFIGFIVAGMPNAKIIYTKRNSKDNCFSIFSNYFGSNFQRWCYDKNALIDFYKLHEEMMKHWISILPNNIFIAEYEDFVFDIEKQSKNLIKYLGLNWEDNCLNFNKNDNVVSTASSMQVRQGIYKTAIAQWENYSKYYNDFFDKLN